MATTTTPEKVKNLLTSFLVKPRQNKENVSSPDTQARPTTADDRGSESLDSSVSGTSAPSSGALRSYEKFMQRLDSFSSLTWFGKPSELSPLVCSRYGWENVDTDMLLCVGCKAFLCGQLPSKTDTSSYNESLAKLKDKLLSSHDKFCVLAANPCPEHFCHVACHDPAGLTAGFVERASALNQIKDRLPKTDLGQLNKLGYDEGQGGAYCKRHLMPDCEVSLEAVTLAFTGWTVCTSNTDVLQCTICRRKVGLWNFEAKSPNTHLADSTSSEDEEKVESSQEDNNGEPSPKKRKIKVSPKSSFDPLEEHRHWCPWLEMTSLKAATTSPVTSPKSPLNKEKFPACIVALRVIAPGLMDNNTGLAHAMKTSPMVEGLRCFRRVLNTWSSPKVHLDSSLT